MALIVEDGSIVANANSYNSRADIIAYAAARGVVLADDDTTDVLAIKAMDYLALSDNDWKGEPVSPTQSLAWPRKGAIPTGSRTAFPDNAIPVQVKKAQCELAVIANSGVALIPTTSAETAFVTREKVDVIETEYSEAIALKLMGSLPDMPSIDALLSPWLRAVGYLTTVRV